MLRSFFLQDSQAMAEENKSSNASSVSDVGPPPRRLVLVEQKGDLFTSTDSLAHCVSLDLHMNAGIALRFKSEFGHADALRKVVKQDGCSVPSVVLMYDKPRQRYIYYLITKERYFDKPTYASLHETLLMMKEHAQANKVGRIAIPRLGCGLDKLEWSRVSADIQQMFRDCDMTITVYSL